MFYTYKDKTIIPTISIKDILANKIPENIHSKNYFKIITGYNPVYIADDYIVKHQEQIINEMKKLSEKCLETNPNYTYFRIPKHSGGFRTITAPDETTKVLQVQIKDFFTNYLHILPTGHAYAYVEGRCAKDALINHINNKSTHYLKIDLKDFFPSCTKEMIIQSLEQHQIFMTLKDINITCMEYLNNIIDFCMLDNGLPQGAPTSPILSNLMMLQRDVYLDKLAQELNMIYTRYADDLIFSKNESFIFKEVVNKASRILQPLKINKKKIRYGTNKGRNWNLGLMVNKDNNITIGHKRKERFRATINNFLNDCKNDNRWDIIDVYELQGIISYYNSINPNMVRNTIEKLDNKYNLSTFYEIKQYLK